MIHLIIPCHHNYYIMVVNSGYDPSMAQPLHALHTIPFREIGIRNGTERSVPSGFRIGAANMSMNACIYKYVLHCSE